MPTDLFASQVSLSRFIERPLFELVLRMTVGDLTKYGLPKPDHLVMASHPIMNTQVLHHLEHGDPAYKSGIDQSEGNESATTPICT